MICKLSTISIYPLLFSHFRKMNQIAKRFMSSSPQPLVIVLTGATSVGKSAVANELCQIIDAEIVIADSVQVFKCLDIGSNKPTKLDQQTVPHHLLDVFDPSDEVSADIFCEKATRAIKDIVSRNKTPIVVGGATMWVQWLVHGKPDAPEATTEITEQARTMLNNAETERDWYAAVEIVREYDPVRIDKLAKNDWYRLRRYLEVGLALQLNGNSDRNTSDYEDDSDSLLGRDSLTGVRSPMLNGLDVRCFFIGEKREDLYLTIDDRCEDMLRGGLLQEVASLLQTDTLMPEHKVSKAIGYRQSLDFLLDRRQRKDGDVSAFQKFVKDFAAATRQYAKRQLAWYRKDNQFLVLRMNRRQLASALSDPRLPYITVCEEILHWVQQSPEAFGCQVQRQVVQGLEHTRLMTTKYFSSNYEIRSDLERRIMCRMVCEGSLKLPTARGSDDCETKKAAKARKALNAILTGDGDSEQKRELVSEPITYPVPRWVTCLLDPAQGVTPTEMAEILRAEEVLQWTADEPDVRSPETANRNNKTRTRRSVFDSDLVSFEIQFRDLIAEADACRRLLLTEKPELVRRYHDINDLVCNIK